MVCGVVSRTGRDIQGHGLTVEGRPPTTGLWLDKLKWSQVAARREKARYRSVCQSAGDAKKVLPEEEREAHTGPGDEVGTRPLFFLLAFN